MAGATKKAQPQRFSLDEYGDPPEPPSVDEIIDDIKKASLDDIVFKSSNAIAQKSKVNTADLELLNDENVLVVPDVDKRKELTPKQAYEMSLKFVERSEKLKSLLKMLNDQSKNLESLNGEVLKCLNQENH